MTVILRYVTDTVFPRNLTVARFYFKALLWDSEGHTIQFTPFIIFMNFPLLLYSLGLEGCWSVSTWGQETWLTAQFWPDSCYTVVRYVHAPKLDHTPNIRTLNFNFCLHRRYLCQGKSRGGHYISACTSTRDRGQDLDPSNFHAWPLDRIENLALTLDYRALTTPIDRLERLWPFLSCLSLTAWPASKFCLDRLTSLWPWSRVGVQSPMQCPSLVSGNQPAVLH